MLASPDSGARRQWGAAPKSETRKPQSKRTPKSEIRTWPPEPNRWQKDGRQKMSLLGFLPAIFLPSRSGRIAAILHNILERRSENSRNPKGDFETWKPVGRGSCRAAPIPVFHNFRRLGRSLALPQVVFLNTLLERKPIGVRLAKSTSSGEMGGTAKHAKDANGSRLGRPTKQPAIALVPKCNSA
jgi:hypothetical protein